MASPCPSPVGRASTLVLFLASRAISSAGRGLERDELVVGRMFAFGFWLGVGFMPLKVEMLRISPKWPRQSA